jgi:hypothetical protein
MLFYILFSIGIIVSKNSQKTKIIESLWISLKQYSFLHLVKFKLWPFRRLLFLF